MNGRADAGAASRTLVMMQWPWTLTMEEQAMRLEARHFYLATTGVCIFLAAQAFQALCIIFWLPEESMTAASDFAIRLGGLDRIRALAVLLGIVALAMTYGVIHWTASLRHRSPHCWASRSACCSLLSKCYIAAWIS